MFAMNMQPAFLFWKPPLKEQSLGLTGKKHRTAKNVAFIVTWSLPWCFRGIFVPMQIGPLELAFEMNGERALYSRLLAIIAASNTLLRRQKC
jgi:hypothetical protein